ncbi:MAG: PorP/SprF family type IX secretion system membrane protein [Bacteroidota bacterium]|nr:PorP/SprF family type IX secretion system membrane protein [Bacteroidota bacterium]
MRFFITIIFCTTCFFLKAQDPNFSQFFASPLTLNPAFTGKFDGQLRIAGNYRNQWPTINNAFTTYTASIDAGILKNNISEVDQFGVGFMAFSDQAGNGVLKSNFLSISTAYHKGLDEDGMNQIGAGFQATYTSKSLDVTKVFFEDQLRSDGFTGISNEVFNNSQLSVNYFDVQAGVLYNGTTNGDNNIYAGISIYHLNRHKETFQNGEYYLEPRITFQAGGRIPLGQFNSFHFSGNHSRQANAINTMIGGAYALNLNADEDVPTNLYLGSWFRFGDAVIPYVGLEWGEFRLGASYDVNTSKLKPGSNMRGGGEFSLIYVRQPRDQNVKKLNCPKF